MNALSGTPNLEKLLAQYAEIGGVVEHTVFARGILTSREIDTHRQAALETLEAIVQRGRQEYERLVQRHSAQRQNSSPWKQLTEIPLRYEGDTIRLDLLAGHKIGLSEFLGGNFPFLCEYYVLLESRSKEAFLNRYAEVLALTEELKPHTGDVLDVRKFDNRGYSYAFSDTPHGMSVPDGERAALFFSIADELFCGFHCPLTIVQWSTNCSNYFDAGHEWWGSFFWTVEPEGADYIVSIVASSTD